MAVKCIKTDSLLYSQLKKLNLSDDRISDFTVKISSDEFKDWYGSGDRDSYQNHPRLKNDIYIVNDKGQKYTVFQILNSKEWDDIEKSFRDESEMDKLSSTLEVLRVSLVRRLSKYKNATGESRIKHKEDLEKLVKELEALKDVDDAQALVKYTEYVTKNSGSINTGLIREDSINYENLSEEDKVKQEEARLTFLLQADTFLNGFEAVEKLEKLHNLTPGVNKAIKTLRTLQISINTTKNEVRSRLQDEIVKMASLSTNPEIVNGVVNFLDSVTDSNGWQRSFEALGDSHNPILAAIDKLYKRTMFKAKEETKRKVNTWHKLQEKLGIKTEKDFNKFINKETGKWIEEVDNDKFYDKYWAYKNKIKYYEKTGRGYDENGLNPSQEYLDLKAEYKEFLRTDAIKIKKSGEAKYVKYIPSQKYKNQQYAALSKEDKEGLIEIRKLLEELVNHTENDFIAKGYIPAFNNKPVNKGEVLSNSAIIGEDGEIVRFLNMKYLSKLNQVELPQLTSGEKDDELYAKREQLIKDNKLAHGKQVNYNVRATIELFIHTATEHKYKKSIENKIRLTNSILKGQKVVDTNGRGSKIIDSIISKDKGEDVHHEKDFIESKSYKQWKDWVEGVFYDEFVLDEGKLTTVVNNLLNYSSVTAMGFNVLSAVNNKIMGNIQLKIEAAGGQYFDTKQYAGARFMYAKGITDYLANMNSNKSTTLIGALIKDFDILQDTKELQGKPEGALETVKAKLKLLKDASYFMQVAGEHQIQNTALIAMLQSHRIIDGKIVSFFDYINTKDISAEVKKMKLEEKSSEEINKYISEFKIDKKALKEEFEKNPSLLESYELKDGQAHLKSDVKIDENELADFNEKVKAVNQKLHGAYNTEDGAFIQRHALGRLAMQFRKWMPNAWNRRFGSKFGKSYWNERRKEYNEGMYVSFYKFVASPFADSFEKYKKEQQKNALKAFTAFLRGFKNGMTNAKVYWFSLSEQEKVNVKRTAMEMLFLASVIAIGFLLKGAGADDEDEKFLTWAVFEADRLYGELSAFTPLGLVYEGKRLTKNPLAVFRTLESVGNLAGAVIAYPFRDEEDRTFSTGIYHGEDKAAIYLQKQLFPPYIQFKYLSEQNQRYGIFK